MRRRRRLAAAAVIALASACGGTTYENAPAASPSSAPPGAGPRAAEPPGAAGATPVSQAPATEEARARSSTSAPAPMPPAPSSAGAASADHADSRSAAAARYRGDFEAASRALETSAGDCAEACRALGSMDRAAGHLCDLTASGAEHGACDDARSRVRAARDRVLRTCGSCPGGPSLEPNAPIPSR